MSKKRTRRPPTVKLPTEYQQPATDPWAFAYLIHGEIKIGKTTFALADSDALLIQFDKPNIGYRRKEIMIENWKHSTRVIKELERRATAGDFPYQSIVVDGVGEWYTMCQRNTCEHFGIDHPSEEEFARGWHKLRDDFLEQVNALLRLQDQTGVAIVFLCHSEWKEKKTSGGGSIERLKPALAAKCDDIINGKVDAWFAYVWHGDRRVMVINGDEEVAAGHRINDQESGLYHFMTTDGRLIKEIDMGSSPAEAKTRFVAAFNNKQDYATIRELLERSKRDRVRKKKTARRSKKG